MLSEDGIALCVSSQGFFAFFWLLGVSLNAHPFFYSCLHALALAVVEVLASKVLATKICKRLNCQSACVVG
jgi:hypothetical protein